MKLANLRGRAVLVHGDGASNHGAIDVETASAGRFSPDISRVFDDWAAFRSWASTVPDDAPASEPFTVEDLGAPVPRPRQVFAIGLNYAAHAAESGMPIPEHPTTFTKFPTCIAAPYAEVALPS